MRKTVYTAVFAQAIEVMAVLVKQQALFAR